MKVETYNIKTQNGRHIRKATVVTRKDGKRIRFMEKLSNRIAIQQATDLPECCWQEDRVNRFY